MSDLSFEVIDEVGTLSENSKSCKKVTIMKWGEKGKPMLDIRKWSADGETPFKGISLTYEETQLLKEMLEEVDDNFF